FPFAERNLIGIADHQPLRDVIGGQRTTLTAIVIVDESGVEGGRSRVETGFEIRYGLTDRVSYGYHRTGETLPVLQLERVIARMAYRVAFVKKRIELRERTQQLSALYGGRGKHADLDPQ